MNISELTPENLAGMIDQTLLKPFVTETDLRRHCEIAARYHFKTVAINNAPLPFCKKVLEGSGVLCDAAVSFPLGQSTIETKVYEAADVISKGAGEVDYVVNLVEVKSGNWDYAEEEMRQLVSVCREHGITSKVIFENCYLTDEEKRHLCEIALRVRPDFIKTSTGFGTGGATCEDVRLMKECVGDKIKIKAAGGIRTIQQALMMIEAGADRIGTSCGVEIVEGLKKLQEDQADGLRKLGGLAHVGLMVADTEKSEEFYCGLLGFKEIYRAGISSPDGEVTLTFIEKDHLVLELVQKPEVSSKQDGFFDHIAFSVTDIDFLVQELVKRGIEFEEGSRTDAPQVFPNGSKWIMFRGPDGEHLELNEII